MILKHSLPRHILRTFAGLLVLALPISQANAAPPSERFELNGMTHLGDTWGFSVKDLENNSSFWIELHQTLGDIHASAYDTEEKVLTLLISGNPVSLARSKSDDKPLAVAKSVNMAGYAEHSLPDQGPTGTPPPPPNGGARPQTSPPDTTPETPDLKQLRKNLSSR